MHGFGIDAPFSCVLAPWPDLPTLHPLLQLLCQSFQMAGEQDRRILKAAATSKRGKHGGTGAAATAAKDAKTFQAGVGGQADAASLLLEGLLLKVRPGPVQLACTVGCALCGAALLGTSS